MICKLWKGYGIYVNGWLRLSVFAPHKNHFIVGRRLKILQKRDKRRACVFCSIIVLERYKVKKGNNESRETVCALS